MFQYANSMHKSLDELYRMANSKSNPPKVKPAVAEVRPAGFTQTKDAELGDYKPSLAKAPAVLTWKDLTVTAQIKNSKEPKVLINGMNGSITGGMWAIMGPSGSGKVSLSFNILYNLTNILLFI